MKVLILVLSAMRDPWRSMLEVGMETWDKDDHPQTQTLYYCGKSDQPSTEKIYFSDNFDEELERVSARTLEAFDMALDIPYWNFIARSHSSTYVHKQNLVDFCETLHRKNLLCGLLTTGLEPFLWGGGSYIISRDVIEQFVANKQKWNLGIMEDNSITNLANELDIPMSGNGRMASINELADGSFDCLLYGIGDNFNFTDWADVKKLHPHYYFRCKQDLRRHRDLDIFRELKKHL